MGTGGKPIIKIVLHVMPYEIDLLQNFYTQLRKSAYYINWNEAEIQVETTLNCSSYFIDWDKSLIKSELFEYKFMNLKLLINSHYKVKHKIQYDNLFGHLDAQREAVAPEVDYYIFATPDIVFGEQLLSYYTQAIQQIKNKYFILTPEIPQMWDYTWDDLVSEDYKKIPYADWQKIDCFEVLKNQTHIVILKPIQNSKFAAWFDLCNKAFFEELVPVWEEWKGYGGWDFYSMQVSQFAKHIKGYDFQQYVLQGQTIVEITTGNLGHSMTKHYKDMLDLKTTPNHGEIFKQNVHSFVEKRIQSL